MRKVLLLMILLIGACSVVPEEGKVFLDSVASKSLYDPSDGEKTGTFSKGGKILTAGSDTWNFKNSPSDNKGVYTRTASNTDYYMSFEYNGESSRYWQTIDFTGQVNNIQIK